MPATFPSSTTVATADAVQDYRNRGWAVAETANGVCLITDDQISAIELTGELAAEVNRFLQANNLIGPVIEIPGSQPREIHLVVGAAKAVAVDAGQELGGAVAVEVGRAEGVARHVPARAEPEVVGQRGVGVD